MKKRFTYIIVAILLSANFFGCSNVDQEKNAVSTAASGEKLKVVTTLFYQYDFTKHIVEDNMDIELLIRAGQESHSYEPTPADIIAIQNADIFIYNGGTSERWVEKVLEDVNDVWVICMMDYVEVVEKEIVEGMEDDHGHDEDGHGHDEDGHSHDEDDHGHDEDGHSHDEDDHGHDEDGHSHDEDDHGHDEDGHGHGEDDHDHDHEEDEHIWTSPVNAQILVQALINEFSAIDSENRETYEANGESLVAELQELDEEFREVRQRAIRTTLVFGDRFPFRYFVDEYDFDYYAAFPGCSTDTDPGVGTITFLLDKIKEEKIPVVYHLELSNEKIADTLCEGTGASKVMFHTAHNVTQEEFDAGLTYVDIMRNNVESLKAGVE